MNTADIQAARWEYIKQLRPAPPQYFSYGSTTVVNESTVARWKAQGRIDRLTKLKRWPRKDIFIQRGK